MALSSLPARPKNQKPERQSPEQLLQQVIDVVTEVVGDRLPRAYHGPLLELAIMGADPEIPEVLRIQANAKVSEFIYARHTVVKDDPKNRPVTVNLIQFSKSDDPGPSVGIVIEGETHAIERSGHEKFNTGTRPPPRFPQAQPEE